MFRDLTYQNVAKALHIFDNNSTLPHAGTTMCRLKIIECIRSAHKHKVLAIFDPWYNLKTFVYRIKVGYNLKRFVCRIKVGYNLKSFVHRISF